MVRSIRDMSSGDLKLYGDIISFIEHEPNSPQARSWVFDKLIKLTKSDFGASYVWDSKAGAFRDGLVHNMDPDNIKRYEQWYQFRDPHTFQLRMKRRVAFVEEVTPYDELRRTEFYNDFLRRDGLDHGINMFLFDGDKDLGDFRLWRARHSPDFGDREAIILENLSPYLRKALRAAQIVPTTLTVREREIVQLVAKGCRDTDISKLLGIGFSTVRTHINKAMEKTGCSNRAELAATLSHRVMMDA